MVAFFAYAEQVTVEVAQRYSIGTPDPNNPKTINWGRNPDGGGIEDALKAQGLSDEEISAITDLKVTTAAGVYIEPDDLAFLHALPQLAALDLGEAETTSMVSRTDNGLPRDAFSGNATIHRIVFPSKLTGFSRGMFANSALQGEVSIPASIVTTIEYNLSFGGSRGITAFQVEEGNQHLKAIDGVLYTIDGTVLLVYPYGKEDASFEIPEGVATIGANAFGWNDFLEELTFSSTVTALVDTRNQFMESSTRIKEFHVTEGNPVFATTNGFLVNKVTGTLMTYPPGKTDETLVIDGSLVKIIPQGYFSYAVANLKSVIFTEGVEEIGYVAFKIGNNVTSVLEYIELPSTITTINGEAFVGNKNLLQVICKATTPPTLLGAQIFRESNFESMRLGVPAESVEVYRTSPWNRNSNSNQNCFTPDQMIAYNTISVVNGTSVQSASVPNLPVKIVADEAQEGYAFVGWTSDPDVAFMNTKTPVSAFTMPGNDITVTANYAQKRPYTLIDALVPGGSAAIGSIVDMEAAPMKGEEIFRRWEVIEGEDVVIDNPDRIAASFVMIDGTVTIAARYARAYFINISGGSAVLEAFAGETVSITATTKPNQEFVNWTSTTPGVVFANPDSQETTFVMPESEADITANFRTFTGIADVQLPVQYTIYNLSGRMVAKGITAGEALPLNGLAAGVYLLRTQNQTFQFINRTK
jgi:uncharacterized repeat protein (TIGR02543 family)